MHRLTLTLLQAQRDALTAALAQLEAAGLSTYPAANMARHYLRKVRWALKEARYDAFNSLAGIIGENGWAPGVTSVLKDAEFELTRLAPDPRLAAHPRAA